MTSISDFIKQEEQKMNRLDRWTGNYPKVKPTLTYATALIKTIPDQTVIKPSLWPKVFAIFFVVFMTPIWALMAITSTQSFVASLVILPLSFAMVCLFIYDSFLNKKNIYHLKLDKTGISISDKLTTWLEIDNTYIMSRMEGKYTNYYLIIFKKDKTIEKLNLRKMSTNHRKLSTLVEYYKLQWRTSELVLQTV